MKNKIVTVVTVVVCFYCNVFAEEEKKLFIFIGEKISVVEFDPEPEQPNENGDVLTLMDSAFKAKYEIIKDFSGNLPAKYIEFEAYDHYGYPRFATFQYVLLFVSQYENQLYHVKYQHFDVYKSKDGRWAYCGKPYGYGDEFESDFPEKLHSVEIDFLKPITYDISDYKQDLEALKDYPKDRKFVEEEIEYFYPNQYFDTSGNTAVCRGKGIYAEDIARAHSKYLLAN